MKLTNLSGVVCCGNICHDMPVWPVERMAWGTTTWVERVERSVGGNGANTSYALATLGVPARLHGLVGADPSGDIVLDTLRAAGVDTSYIGRSQAPTTMSICVVHPSGDRLFLHKVGASSEVEASAVAFDPAFSHFHLANLFALPKLRLDAAALMRRARDAGSTTSLDTGWDTRGRWIEDVGPCLPYTDLLFVNDTEAKMLAARDDPHASVEHLLGRMSDGVIVLKTGAGGCAVYTASGRIAAPAFPVDVLDTTGAGDCFAGGFLAGLHRGFSLSDAARFANAVGALNVQQLGAAQGVRSFEATLAWIDARSKLDRS